MQRELRAAFMALSAVGWADGHLDGEEADAIVRAAIEMGLELDEIEAIERATREPLGRESLDWQPLSSLPKLDRLLIYALGSWISRVDGGVSEAEQEALAQLGEALEIPRKPRQQVEALVARVAAGSESEQAAFFDLPALREALARRIADAQRWRRAAATGEFRGQVG